MTQSVALPSSFALLQSIAEPMRWRILDALAKGPKTATALALQLGTTSQHVNWHCSRLEEVGLVSVSRINPEAGGMKVKHYHLVPREFTIRVTPDGAKVTSKRA